MRAPLQSAEPNPTSVFSLGRRRRSAFSVSLLSADHRLLYADESECSTATRLLTGLAPSFTHRAAASSSFRHRSAWLLSMSPSRSHPARVRTDLLYLKPGPQNSHATGLAPDIDSSFALPSPPVTSCAARCSYCRLQVRSWHRRKTIQPVTCLVLYLSARAHGGAWSDKEFGSQGAAGVRVLPAGRTRTHPRSKFSSLGLLQSLAALGKNQLAYSISHGGQC